MQIMAGGTKASGLSPEVETFLSSLSIDSKLLDDDLQASIAHATMLGERGILGKQDAEAIADCLRTMRAEAAAGELFPDPESEDIHSFIEAELTRRLGEVGKAVHAGRSRNDQVATAFRLRIVKAFQRTEAAVYSAIEAIVQLAEKNSDSLMPGYTHLQKAQPITLAHHLLAWGAALERDASRFRDGRARADECPLGSGALAGSGLPIDRERTASVLGFARPSRNTMDAVADRDACVEYAAACANLMAHLSRACEDMALWASSEYGFVRVGDSASTGSSIMPQKRNPDPAELIRGKSARVFGNLQALLVLQKGLAYAYNRDLQEDKELFFDLETTTTACLKAFAVLVSALEPRKDRMRKALDEGFSRGYRCGRVFGVEGDSLQDRLPGGEGPGAALPGPGQKTDGARSGGCRGGERGVRLGRRFLAGTPGLSGARRLRRPEESNRRAGARKDLGGNRSFEACGEPKDERVAIGIPRWKNKIKRLPTPAFSWPPGRACE